MSRKGKLRLNGTPRPWVARRAENEGREGLPSSTEPQFIFPVGGKK